MEKKIVSNISSQQSTQGDLKDIVSTSPLGTHWRHLGIFSANRRDTGVGDERQLLRCPACDHESQRRLFESSQFSVRCCPLTVSIVMKYSQWNC